MGRNSTLTPSVHICLTFLSCVWDDPGPLKKADVADEALST